MERFITRFWKEEDGNTTVDWMVLTAGIVMLGAAVMAAVGPQTQSLAEDTSEAITQIDTGV